MESKRHKVAGIKITDIVISEEPLKDMDYQLFQKLKSSIEKRGQIRTILVCELENGKYECLEGAKIVKAIKENGQDEVLAVNMGILSENEKALIKLENFRDYFLTNYVEVGKKIKQLTEVMRIGDICNTIPFDIRQAEHLISMTEFDWDAFSQNKQIEGQVSLFEIIEDVVCENDIEKEQQIAEEFQPPIEEEIVNEVEQEVLTNINEVVNPYHVFLDNENKFSLIPEEQVKSYEKTRDFVSLFRGTFSDCRLFINQKENKNEN